MSGKARHGILPTDDIEGPDVLVERLHIVQNRAGLGIKEMAERCGAPKSSRESCMRLKGARETAGN